MAKTQEELAKFLTARFGKPASFLKVGDLLYFRLGEERFLCPEGESPEQFNSRIAQVLERESAGGID